MDLNKNMHLIAREAGRQAANEGGEREVPNMWGTNYANQWLVGYDEVISVRASSEKAKRDRRQRDMLEWAVNTFKSDTCNPADILERSRRFIEEAAELVQACGLPLEEVLRVVQFHVYCKDPDGNVPKELGQSAMTLAALAAALDYSLYDEEIREWQRVQAIDPDVFKKRHEAKQAKGI